MTNLNYFAIPNPKYTFKIKRLVSVCFSLLFFLHTGLCITVFFEGGDWHEPTNWLNDLMPEDNDDVIVLGNGTISQSIEVQNINVANHEINISDGTVTARAISVGLAGKLVNAGTIDLIKFNASIGNLQVSGEFRNTGIVNFIGTISSSGIVSNSGTLTGSPNSLISSGNGGIFDNFGTINGVGVNFQINNGTFNNNAIINLDQSVRSNFVVTSTGYFNNVGSIKVNTTLAVSGDAVFENRNIINSVNALENRPCLQLRDDGIFRNFVNLELIQLASFDVGLTMVHDTQFENYGLVVLKNAHVTVNTNKDFRNLANAEFHISNTDNEGLKIFSANLFTNEGILSVCQSNQVTGTCPILVGSGSILNNLPGSELYTGVDIFNGNCSSTTINRITNQGQIIAGCSAISDLNCPLNYAGVNSITGTFITQNKFESDGAIEAIDAVMTQGPFTFDSGESITLNTNFEVNLNTVFEAIIDGCGGI